ncbi:cold-shock protein [Parafilimonas terrae]|jgi:cold shock CspA family protein|uniref:Cold-shock DNA-binding protein family n=1 Tax=Parafilimonas terrae TaxID=1465490 RepID=A0A1I5VWF7_9BACT|nr:cold shock domain-containing protein [Parafilimonas terrae]SFQ11743.1 cold-shock DNA-binding protein family [Parafilimonas terrae]
MSKSKETFNKKEKEKKRLKKKQEKMEKMQERKANAEKGKSLDAMMAYVDENGNLSSTPPDPKKRKVFNHEDMNTGVPVRVEEDTERQGVVDFFNDAKGFGFIKDAVTRQSVFVHINQLSEPIKENDRVSFQMERGPKGMNAVQVKKLH